MNETGITAIILLITNGLFTYKGLTNTSFLDKYSFRVDKVLVNKEYHRLITSGFLHTNWIHFGFNMVTLYLFSTELEFTVGIPKFFMIYFGSLIAGNLFALFINRNNYHYAAIGASGAISGIVFASICLMPGLEIGLILFPVYIPGWLFGFLYVIYSIYGIRSKNDNIGHEAHLGGGIGGLIIAILLYPFIVNENPLPIILILLPSLIFLFLIIKMPHILLLNNINPFSRTKGIETFEDRYNTRKLNEEKELNKILDKINNKGFDNLSKKEKERLKELSK
jgi:membrane associated rhomboid family serine protease